MKTISILAFLMIFSVALFGCTPEQVDQIMKDDSTAKNPIENKDAMGKENMEKASMGDGYELKDGKMVIVNEVTHEMLAMQNDVTLKDGTRVMTSGKVIRTDGTSFMLKEGESMWMDGSFMEAKAMMEEGTTDSGMMGDKDDSMMQNKESMQNEPELLAGTISKYYRYDEAHFKKSLAEGKIIMLDFHANWCPICQNERPGIVQAFNELDDPNVVGYEVHFNDGETTNEDNAAIKQYQITYQHTKVFIKDGKVVQKSLEKLTKTAILEKIKEVAND